MVFFTIDAYSKQYETHKVMMQNMSEASVSYNCTTYDEGIKAVTNMLKSFPKENMPNYLQVAMKGIPANATSYNDTHILASWFFNIDEDDFHILSTHELYADSLLEKVDEVLDDYDAKDIKIILDLWADGDPEYNVVSAVDNSIIKFTFISKSIVDKDRLIKGLNKRNVCFSF